MEDTTTPTETQVPGETVRLSGPYAGWEAELDGDPAGQVFIDLGSANIERIYNAVLHVITRWNFKAKAAGEDTDATGSAVTWQAGETAPLTPKGVASVPFRAVLAMIRSYKPNFSELPN